ncbi:hypothetical protein OU995_18190 [Roseateles sp. SL47]|uniref:subtype B tannase n=1 Tax=Roseateles sp. SL47 TaxID=2995138 RepID=UPI002271CB0C|nr:subtype B tannase [Roseateles sp. SL47]WAC71503.1 hypothetical protein OU995_18190 [Roseateles sp. SL47]
MKRFQARHAAPALSVLMALMLATGALAGSGRHDADSDAADDSALTFDASNYTRVGVTIDGTYVPVRWYKNVCYVKQPVLMATTQTGLGGATQVIDNPQCGYQNLNIFVPEASLNDPKTALYLAVNNGGWMASYQRASVTDGATLDSSTSNVGAALKAGYVYVDVATRGRNVVAADATYPGRSPAVVVDAKAAVRYLRLNDARMPGSAERIVVNGTSGGGGLVSILGASGNSPDYLPYLAAIGAAGIDKRGRSTLRDDVLAVVAYCPITDLGHADLAYEWLFTALNSRALAGTSNANPTASAELASRFPAYQRSLGLRNADGQRLTADNMLATIQAEVIRSAETAMRAGTTLPKLGESFTVSGMGGSKTYVNDWMDVDTTTQRVLSLDMTRYLAFVATQATLKPTPAFDQSGLSVLTNPAGESNLFGTPTQLYSNFTDYSWNHNDKTDGVGLDETGLTWTQFLRQPGTRVDEQIRLIDPLAFIGSQADTSPYWYVRHGTRDRDTAFTVSINLSRALAADRKVADVNYRLAWNQPHAGNYDVPEAMAWVATVLKAAERRGR